MRATPHPDALQVRQQLQQQRSDSLEACKSAVPPELTLLYARSIGAALLLNIVTLGIFGLFWTWKIIRNHHILADEGNACLKEFLLLLFVPFYAIFWYETRGRSLCRAARTKGFDVPDRSMLHALLAVAGLNIVNLCLMQHAFNGIADGSSLIDPPKAASIPRSQPFIAAAQKPENKRPEPAPAAIPAPDRFWKCDCGTKNPVGNRVCKGCLSWRCTCGALNRPERDVCTSCQP